MSRLALLIVGVVLLLVGCGAPAMTMAPLAFASPLRAPAGQRVLFPLVLGGAHKLGMAGCPGSCREFGCHWCYSWWPTPGTEAGRESVPMIWDEQQIGRQLGGNSAWVMGWNEPDIAGQANISPAEGARLWREMELTYADRKLVAPAPSHRYPGWLPAFRAAYRELWGGAPRLDALAVHCYFQSARECIGLVEQFKAWASDWGVGEIWVTEFAFLPAYCDAPAEVRAFVGYLEGERLVTRYAPYVSIQQCGDEWWDCEAAGDPSLVQADGRTPTELGRLYAQPPENVAWWGRGW